MRHPFRTLPASTWERSDILFPSSGALWKEYNSFSACFAKVHKVLYKHMGPLKVCLLVCYPPSPLNSNLCERLLVVI